MPERKHTIYVQLLNEGTDVWRPVEAEHLGADQYQIVSVNLNSDDELWQFPSGAVVTCRQQRLSGEDVFVAEELAK